MHPIAEAPTTPGTLLRLHPATGAPFLGYWCRPLRSWVEDRGRTRIVRENIVGFEYWDQRARKIVDAPPGA